MVKSPLVKEIISTVRPSGEVEEILTDYEFQLDVRVPFSFNLFPGRIRL